MMGQVYAWWNCERCGLPLEVHEREGTFVMVAMGRVVTSCPECGMAWGEGSEQISEQLAVGSGQLSVNSEEVKR